MKIILTPSELAAQLPELRLDILQMHESSIVLEGKEAQRKLRPWDDPKRKMSDRFPILKRYPDFVDIFTPKELLMLSELMYGEKRTRYLQSVFEASSNMVDVVIKNIRKKIEKHKLPIALTTVRRTGFRRLEALEVWKQNSPRADKGWVMKGLGLI